MRHCDADASHDGEIHGDVTWFREICPLIDMICPHVMTLPLYSQGHQTNLNGLSCHVGLSIQSPIPSLALVNSLTLILGHGDEIVQGCMTQYAPLVKTFH